MKLKLANEKALDELTGPEICGIKVKVPYPCPTHGPSKILRLNSRFAVGSPPIIWVILECGCRLPV
jgi:hypothetical protein